MRYSHHTKYANGHSVIRQPPNPTLLSSPIECWIRVVSLYVCTVHTVPFPGDFDEASLTLEVPSHSKQSTRLEARADAEWIHFRATNRKRKY